MSVWEILGIDPTDNKDDIQRAYYGKLPEYHPEEDPEGFQRLRSAYEEALQNIGNKDIEDDDIGLFIKDVAELYDNFSKRIKVESWRAVIDREVCNRIDSSEEAGDALLTFLMEKYYMPHEVWKFLNNFFGWSERKDQLYEKFPPNFIDFVMEYSRYEIYIRYDKFNCSEDIDYDKFIRLYNTAYREINNKNIYESKKAIDEARSICPGHIDLMILFIRYKKMMNDIDRAKELCDYILNNNPEEKDVYYSRADCFLKKGNLQGAYEDYESAFKLEPTTSCDFYNMAFILSLLEKPEEAKEYLNKILDDREYCNLANYLLIDINHMIKDSEFEGLMREVQNDPLNLDKNKKVVDSYLSICDYKSSYKYLKELDKKVGLNWELKMIMGSCCMELDNKKEALEYFQKSSKLNPNEARPYGFQATILHDFKRYDEALEIYDKAIELSDKKGILLNNKAHLLSLMGRYNEAVENCNLAIAEGEEDLSYAYNNRAKALLELGEYDEALLDCDRAISINSYIGGPYRNKAKIYNRTNRYYEAIEVCENAFRMGLNDSYLMYEKANSLYNLGEISEVKEICISIIEKEPEYDEPYYLMGEIYYNAKDYNVALKYYRQAANRNPKKGFYMVCVADVYKIMKNIAKAFEYYSKSIELMPGYRYSLIERANISRDLGEYEEAIADIKSCLKIKEDAVLYNDLGQLYCEIGKDPLECYNKAVDMDPYYNNVYINRGTYFFKKDDYEKAMSDYEKAIEVSKDYALPYYLKGLVYMILGQYEEAILEMKTSLDIDNDYYNAYLKISECYNEIGKYETAIQYLNEAINKESKWIEAYKIRAVSFYNIGKYEDAIEDSKYCLKCSELSVEEITDIYKYMARSLKKLNKIEAALRVYKHVILKNPDDEEMKKEYEELKGQTSMFRKVLGMILNK